MSSKGSAPFSFAQLMGTEKYSDLKFVCQGKEFKVHKAIVCTQSPVLAAACNGAKHRLDGFGMFGIIRFVDAVCVHPVVFEVVLFGLLAAESNFDITGLALARSAVDILKCDSIFIGSPRMGQDRVDREVGNLWKSRSLDTMCDCSIVLLAYLTGIW